MLAQALEELVSYDPHLIVGILGGAAGTTYDAFKLLSEARKYGARVALFGRKINNAENQFAFIRFLRLIADKAIARAEFAGADVKVIALAALRSTREAEARSGRQRLAADQALDQQVLGVLPVSARTIATARLSAALVVGAVFVTAVSLPAAIGYSLVSAVHPVLGSRFGIMAGQAASTIGAGVFTFVSVVTVRGLLVFAVGAAAAARAAILLQVATVLLLVEAFLFLPGILPSTLRHLMTPGVAGDTWLPPAWFRRSITRARTPAACIRCAA